ncbi:hypothetical protein BC828DRAFT_394147 [Blastocladiella britannica]|nr:hypothetical protein BC828DRAFT_394147 [Blastocladiella britannica]
MHGLEVFCLLGPFSLLFFLVCNVVYCYSIAEKRLHLRAFQERSSERDRPNMLIFSLSRITRYFIMDVRGGGEVAKSDHTPVTTNPEIQGNGGKAETT